MFIGIKIRWSRVRRYVCLQLSNGIADVFIRSKYSDRRRDAKLNNIREGRHHAVSTLIAWVYIWTCKLWSTHVLSSPNPTHVVNFQAKMQKVLSCLQSSNL